MITQLSIDHPSNRLGEIVFQRPGTGEVRQHKGMFYSWATGEGRGYENRTYTDALDSLGRRLGYDEEGFGQNRVGKCIEKYETGEIWKDGSFYYVWQHDIPDVYGTLTAARKKLDVVIQVPPAVTLPKSSYPQNQKGYKPSTGTAKAKAAVK